MKLPISFGIAVLGVLTVIAVLTYASIPKADGAYAKYCIDGVSYLHFANGPMIQRDRKGDVVTCEQPNPKRLDK